jgi:hypothetical protein
MCLEGTHHVEIRRAGLRWSLQNCERGGVQRGSNTVLESAALARGGGSDGGAYWGWRCVFLSLYQWEACLLAWYTHILIR